MGDFLRLRLQELLTVPQAALLMAMHSLQMSLNSRRRSVSVVTARADVGSVAYVGVDVHADVVDVEGAGAVGAGEDLLADFEVQEVLCAVGKHEGTVAAAPRELVVAVHYEGESGSSRCLRPIIVYSPTLFPTTLPFFPNSAFKSSQTDSGSPAP